MSSTTTAGRKNWWSAPGRVLVFSLAASSILCLLLDFYQVCPMRLFTIWVFVPCLLALGLLTVIDLRSGTGRLARAVGIGFFAGLLAAVSYDIFRLPFVFSREWGLASIIPPMPLFKVFPGFGAMILGQPIEQSVYSPAAELLGWAYHFSNGTTFGVMYLAMIGHPGRRSWLWAVVFAMGLELGMLFTPYPRVFGIDVGAKFVVVTLAAHGIFGVMMGLAVQWFGRKGLA